MKGIIYDGPAEEFVKIFRDGREVRLLKGIPTYVDDDIFNYLISTKKKNNLAAVTDFKKHFLRERKK